MTRTVTGRVAAGFSLAAAAVAALGTSPIAAQAQGDARPSYWASSVSASGLA